MRSYDFAYKLHDHLILGVMEEGAVGLLKGTGRGLVGLLVRPAGGLIDLTSGTLEFVTR